MTAGKKTPKTKDELWLEEKKPKKKWERFVTEFPPELVSYSI